jgi:hypothetical protein
MKDPPAHPPASPFPFPSGVAGPTSPGSQGNGELVFGHQGVLTPSTLPHLLALTEDHCQRMGEPIILRKRLYSMVVEGLDNIQRHAEVGPGTFPEAALLAEQRGYRLFLGNHMPRVLAAVLEHRLLLLNEMDEVDLKEQYRRLLAYSGRTGQGGAGLGLYAMARKSTRPMLLHQHSQGPHHVYGVLELRLLRALYH